MALPVGRGLIALGLVAPLFVSAVTLDDDMTVWAAQAKAPILDLLVGIIDPIGRGVTLLVACAALALLARRCGRTRLCEAARLGALAFMYAGLVEFTLKHLVGRPRPNVALAAGGLGPSWTPGVDSFPSGHATSVFAVAAVFGTFYPWLRLPLYMLAAAIALGRVYLERHYLSDVVAGAVLGVMVAVWLHRRRRADRTGVDPEAGR